MTESFLFCALTELMKMNGWRTDGYSISLMFPHEDLHQHLPLTVLMNDECLVLIVYPEDGNHILLLTELMMNSRTLTDESLVLIVYSEAVNHTLLLTGLMMNSRRSNDESLTICAEDAYNAHPLIELRTQVARACCVHPAYCVSQSCVDSCAHCLWALAWMGLCADASCVLSYFHLTLW